MSGTRLSPPEDAAPAAMLAEYLLPLRPFLAQGGLTEICVNRPREIWTEGAQGWVRHSAAELSFAHCRQLATLIASYNGKSIGPTKPVLSASLPGGERVQVVIPPACEAHTVSLTIRKPTRVDKTLEELDQEGAFATARSSMPARPCCPMKPSCCTSRRRTGSRNSCSWPCARARPCSPSARPARARPPSATA